MEVNLEKIWAEYLGSRDSRLREKIVHYYQPLVMYVARGFKLKGARAIEFDDLVSAGNIGLLEAIDRFNPERNVKFETYATLRIRGSIIDLLRKNDRASKLTRKKIKSVVHVIGKLQNKLGRNPSDGEIASELAMDIDEYRKVLYSMNAVQIVSLQDILATDENGTLTRDQITDSKWQDHENEAAEYEELRDRLIEALGTLPSKEKLLLILYYYEGLNLAEIANVLSVTESRACQLHTQALLRIKSQLTNLALATV